MLPIFRYILLTTLVIAALPGNAALKLTSLEKKQIIDSLKTELRHENTPSERISMLTDMYDLSINHSFKDSVGNALYETALKSGDSAAGLDILRHMGNLHIKEDSLLAADIIKAQKFQPSDDRTTTVVFLRMLRNHNGLWYSDEATRTRRIQQLLELVTVNPPADTYDKIVLLHALCLYIGNAAKGDMLVHYLEKLEELIESLPDDNIPLRNAFYVQASIVYRANDNYKKALEIDRRLLGSIAKLEERNAKSGRKYRNYDGNYYLIYTRMLSNYPLLSDEEVEDIYGKIQNLLSTDELAAGTEALSGRAHIYYAMHHQRYDEALQLIYQYKDNYYNKSYLNILYRLMVECARKTGNREALLEALEGYNGILEQTLESRTHEKAQELQIIYDVNELKEQSIKREHQAQKTRTLILLIGTIAMFLLLVVMLFMYQRIRKMASRLKQSNDDLKAEKANLQKAQADLMKARDEAQTANRTKSDFIKNMSTEVEGPLHVINEYTSLLIDCVDTGDKPYLRNFSDKIQFSAELLSNIFSDVLTLAQADNNTLTVHPKKADIKTICENAIATVRHHVNDNVSIGIAPDLPSVPVDTDTHRLTQILYQLLSNAAKFTHEGSITLSYQAYPAVNSVKIIVTDTGIGVPPEEKERIFQRFSKLNHSSQGTGLGLSLAMQLAKLLGGNIELDTSYENGARFILTIPMTIIP